MRKRIEERLKSRQFFNLLNELVVGTPFGKLKSVSIPEVVEETDIEWEIEPYSFAIDNMLIITGFLNKDGYIFTLIDEGQPVGIAAEVLEGEILPANISSYVMPKDYNTTNMFDSPYLKRAKAVQPDEVSAAKGETRYAELHGGFEYRWWAVGSNLQT